LCILNNLWVILVGDPYSSNLLAWFNNLTESGLIVGIPGILDVDIPAKNGSRLGLGIPSVTTITGLCSFTNWAGTESLELI